MAASECIPFCKTGGLADVVGSLPPALGTKSSEVRLALPKYREISENRHKLKDTGLTLNIPLGESLATVRIWEGKLAPRIPVYFIDSPRHFGRDGLYVDPQERPYPDNDERFILFSRAVLETAKAVGFQPDVIHCHDWQTGLIPVYLATLYGPDSFFLTTATLLTVHNIAYQGAFPKTTLSLAGLPWKEFTPEKLEYYGQVNFLKGGLVYSTLLNTVSPTYAREIKENPEFGCGMEGILNARQADFSGILNGIDTADWDPAKDPHLPARFSPKDLAGKRACKQALQKKLGLKEDPMIPLAGVVSRLDRQKGLDLIAESAPELFKRKIQVAVLGNGDPALRKQLEETSRRHPERFAFRTGFEEPLAHLIYAGSDFFLMPSRFEPCGLSQMIAMRYGSVPVVTRRGGLADTVDAGTGFVITEFSVRALTEGIRSAVEAFRDQKKWAGFLRRGMSRDFSWSRSVKDYLALYRRAQAARKGVLPHAP